MSDYKRDELGTRMKENYENRAKTSLVRRMPVAIRIDGKAFHTFTKHFKKPFDRILMDSMQETMKYLCENIQGCVFGYTQSDEITLILIDYQTLTTDAWFDYEVQKMCSVAASMATMAFNKIFSINVYKYFSQYAEDITMVEDKIILDHFATDELEKHYTNMLKAIEKGAMFDARCFNIPKEEVTNLIYWRQLDAIRNSIQMVGHTNFSQEQLYGKTCNDIQDMLMNEKGINWNDFPIDCKRGAACVRIPNGISMGKLYWEWHLDKEMPILKGEDREYVERFLEFRYE